MRPPGKLIAAAMALLLTTTACGAPPPSRGPAQNPVSTPSRGAGPRSWWRPALDLGPFLYQLQGLPLRRATGGIQVGECYRPAPSSGCVRPKVYDIDLYVDSAVDGRNDVPNRSAVAAIHAAGAWAVCYVDAGTWEAWRPDAGRFPRALLGRPDGWPGERWLDIRQLRALLPIMTSRARQCASAGFNAIDWDNVDGYQNRTGFRLTAGEQIRYDLALAKIAHRLGLGAGLKNDYSQVSALASAFDFGVDEQCYQYHECYLLAPFLKLHKPVYDVEYQPGAFCPATRAEGIWATLQSTSLYPRPWAPCEPELPGP